MFGVLCACHFTFKPTLIFDDGTIFAVLLIFFLPEHQHFGFINKKD